VLLWDRKRFKILPDNGVENVIAEFVVRAKPNPNQKCVTQPRTPIPLTSITIPLVLVKGNSYTREASWVTLGGLQRRSQGKEWITPIGHNERFWGD
jgi:hypothetical protein